MRQPDALARESTLSHLAAQLKTAHGRRLMARGYTMAEAAEMVGYKSAASLRHAMREYRSPAPAGTGSEAEANTRHDCTTKEEKAQ